MRERPWMPWKMGLKGQRGGMNQFIYLPSAPVLVASGKQPIAGIQRKQGSQNSEDKCPPKGPLLLTLEDGNDFPFIHFFLV